MKNIIIALIIMVSNIYCENEFLETLKQRSITNVLDVKIQKINKLSIYINRYIINFGKIPKKVDLQVEYPEILQSWPFIFGTNTRITTEITNKNIKFERLLPEEIIDEKITNIYKYNKFLSQEMIFNANLDIIVLLDIESIEFLKKVKILREKDINVGRLDQVDSLICSYGIDNDMNYEPNGSGEFNTYICKDENWKRLNQINTVNYKKIDDVLVNIGNNPYLFYNELNSTHVNEEIYINKDRNIRIVK